MKLMYKYYVRLKTLIREKISSLLLAEASVIEKKCFISLTPEVVRDTCIIVRALPGSTLRPVSML